MTTAPRSADDFLAQPGHADLPHNPAPKVEPPFVDANQAIAKATQQLLRSLAKQGWVLGSTLSAVPLHAECEANAANLTAENARLRQQRDATKEALKLALKSSASAQADLATCRESRALLAQHADRITAELDALRSSPPVLAPDMRVKITGREDMWAVTNWWRPYPAQGFTSEDAFLVRLIPAGDETAPAPGDPAAEWRPADQPDNRSTVGSEGPADDETAPETALPTRCTAEHAHGRCRIHAADGHTRHWTRTDYGEVWWTTDAPPSTPDELAAEDAGYEREARQIFGRQLEGLRAGVGNLADEYERDARLVDTTQANELHRFAGRLRSLLGAAPTPPDGDPT